MSELGALLSDTVTRLFTDLVTKELIEAAEKGTWPARLWQAVEEAGLTHTLVPEAAGGAGGSWRDAWIVVSATGRHAAPVPLAETIVAAWLLAGAGLAVPDGPITLAPVRDGEQIALARRGDGWRASGTVTRVPWGGAAAHLVTVAPAERGLTVALLSTAAAGITPDRNIALEPRDTLAFADAPVVAAGPAPRHLDARVIERYGALVRSAQIAGALQSALEQSVRYAGERRQFGRAIGAFQAIQHQLAVLAGHAAAAGIAAEHAFDAADHGDPAFAIAVAKVRAGEAAGLAAGIAHQVHGAIGFTYEHSLHFATRRLWSWRAEFGPEHRWAAELGRAAVARGPGQLWPSLTG
jgi:acyl-CoA dehydrogenase